MVSAAPILGIRRRLFASSCVAWLVVPQSYCKGKQQCEPQDVHSAGTGKTESFADKSAAQYTGIYKSKRGEQHVRRICSGLGVTNALDLENSLNFSLLLVGFKSPARSPKFIRTKAGS